MLPVHGDIMVHTLRLPFLRGDGPGILLVQTMAQAWTTGGSCAHCRRYHTARGHQPHVSAVGGPVVHI